MGNIIRTGWHDDAMYVRVTGDEGNNNVLSKFANSSMSTLNSMILVGVHHPSVSCAGLPLGFPFPRLSFFGESMFMSAQR